MVGREMEQSAAKIHAHKTMEMLWYLICESYFQKIVVATGLDKDREAAARAILLRPGDFRVRIAGSAEEMEDG